MNVKLNNTGLWSLHELKPGMCFQYIENTSEIFMCVDNWEDGPKNHKLYVNLKTGHVDYQHTWEENDAKQYVNRVNATCIVTNSRMPIDRNIWDDEFHKDYIDKEGLEDD